MKRLKLAGVILLGMILPVLAQTGTIINPVTPVINGSSVGAANPLPIGACTCTPVTPSQNNVSISSATTLTVPTGAAYAVVQAVGGTAYYTYDGSTPSSSNFSGYLAQGQAISLQGAAVLSAFKIIGTSMGVSYFK